MKKILVIFFILNSLLYSNFISNNKNNAYIKGTLIIKGFSLLPSHIEIVLEDSHDKSKDFYPLIIGNNFYFLDLPLQKSYEVKIIYNSEVFQFNIETIDKINHLGTLYINPSKTDTNKNNFIIFFIFFIIIANILALSVLYKKRKKTYEKSLYYSLIAYIFSLSLIFLGDILSFKNEMLATKFISLSLIPESIFYILLLRTIIYYKRKKAKIFSISIYYIFILIQIISIPIVIFFINPHIFENFLCSNYFNIDYFFIILILFSFTEYFFLLFFSIAMFRVMIEQKKNKDNKDKRIPLYFLITTVLFFIKIIHLFLVPQNFKGYLSLYLENLNIFIFSLVIIFMCINYINYKFTKNKNTLNILIYKTLKYFISFNLTYLVLGFSDNAYIAYLFLAGFLLSDIFSLISKLILKNKKNTIEKITDMLEIAETEEEFSGVLENELKNIAYYRNIKYIFFEQQQEIFEFVKENTKTRVIQNSLFLDHINNYDYLIKIIYNQKLIGILLIDNNGDNISNTELDYLINLSDSIAGIAQTLRIKKIKDMIKVDANKNYKSLKENELEDALLLNLEFVKLIEKEASGNDKIVKYCQAIKDRIKEIYEGDSHV